MLRPGAPSESAGPILDRADVGGPPIQRSPPGAPRTNELHPPELGLASPWDRTRPERTHLHTPHPPFRPDPVRKAKDAQHSVFSGWVRALDPGCARGHHPNRLVRFWTVPMSEGRPPIQYTYKGWKVGEEVELKTKIATDSGYVTRSNRGPPADP